MKKDTEFTFLNELNITKEMGDLIESDEEEIESTETEEEEEDTDIITPPLVIFAIIDLLFGKLLPLLSMNFSTITLGIYCSITLFIICLFNLKRNAYYFLLLVFVILSFVICGTCYVPAAVDGASTVVEDME
ncbi:MAG: hypothetical protein IJ193_05175 [Bacilli bacterium]|nr:hypothetical protein [Bacilli bacterium]